MSRRTEALESAIEAMIGKLEEFPSNQYTQSSTFSLANAMNALAKSYEIDQAADRHDHPLKSYYYAVPSEISDLIARLNELDDNGIRFNAFEIGEAARDIEAKWSLMLKRTVKIPPEPAEELPEDDVRRKLAPSERALFDQFRDAAETPQPVTTPVGERQWDPNPLDVEPESDLAWPDPNLPKWDKWPVQDDVEKG